jgi:DNA replication protein DnaC
MTHGHSVIYVDGLAVLQNLMALKPSRIQKPLAELTSVDLLFIDDFLTLPMSAAEQELIRHLIAMREKSTVLISARHTSSWHICSSQLIDRLNIFLSHALWLDLYDRGYCPPARRK